jgi:hypothetical protein
MRKLKTLLLTGAVALVALAAVTATASAFEASVSGGESIASSSLGKLTFEGPISIECGVTLRGALLSGPIGISAGARIGSISAVQIASCEGGRVRAALVEEGSPWDIQIGSVPAGLPNEVEALEIVVKQSKFQLSIFGEFINCLYQGDAPSSLEALHFRGGGENEYKAGLAAVLANSESLVSGGFGCPSRGSFSGSFALSPAEVVISVSS